MIDVTTLLSSLPEGVSEAKRTARHAIVVGPSGARIYVPLDGRAMAYASGLDVGWDGDKLSCKGDDAGTKLRVAVELLGSQERRQRRRAVASGPAWPTDLPARKSRLERALRLMNDRGHAVGLDAAGRIDDPVRFYAGMRDLVEAGLLDESPLEGSELSAAVARLDTVFDGTGDP